MGLFQTIFGGNRPTVSPVNQLNRYELLNSYDQSLNTTVTNAWDDATVRAAVDAFARRAAVVLPRHIRRAEGAEIDQNDAMNRILQYAPNPYTTAYKFYYRLAANYKIYNGAFVYPVYSPITGKLEALYNINASDIRLKEYKGEMFVQFTFLNGKRYTWPFNEVIYVGGHFLDNDVFGSCNSPLAPVLATSQTFNKSMSKFAQMVSAIRGILKISGVAKNADLNERRDEFIRDNLKLENNGSGIIVTDNKYEYQPISGSTAPIPSEQLAYVKSSIYEYFGVNEAIVTNSETPDQAKAYYNGELKPFFVQLSQAMTNTLFTDKERGYGNEIVADINTLKYATIADKLATVNYLTQIGALSLDQALTTLGFAPIGGEEGSRRVQALNMVNADKADEYQGVDEPNDEPVEEPATEGEE